MTKVVGVIFVCPFCQGKCEASAEGEPYVLHSLPTCEKFDSLTIDEYLHQVRLRYDGSN